MVGPIADLERAKISPYPASLILLALAVGATTLIGSLLSPGLVVQADEGSYLLNAAAIVGKLKYSALLSDYSSGYSLLLAPAFLLFSDLDRIYRCVLVINALAMMATPIAIFRLTTLLYPRLDSRWHVLAAAAAGFYGDVLALGQFALSENVLVPLYAWTLAFAAMALLREQRRIRSSILGGICAGSLLLVHARGGPMALAILVAATLPCIWRRELRPAISLLWISALAVAAAHLPLEYLAGKSAGHYPFASSMSQIIARVLPASAWFDAFRNLLGATAYAAIASMGMVILALRPAARTLLRTWRTSRQVDANGAIWLACLLGTFGCILTTAIWFTPPARLDHIIYGRYVLPTIVPLIGLGALSLALPPRERLVEIAWALSTSLTLLVLIAAALRYAPGVTPRFLNTVNVTALHSAFVVAGSSLNWWFVAGLFLVQCTLVYGLTMYRPAAGILAYAAVGIFLASFFTIKFTVPSRILYNQDRTIVADTSNFESTTGTPLCIAIDQTLSDWYRIDYATRLFRNIDASAIVDSSKCAHAFITSLKKPSRSVIGMRLISEESRFSMFGAPVGLFAESGSAVDAYARKHALPAMESLEPLPEKERMAKIIVEPFRHQIAVGEPLQLNIHLEHAGAQFVWSSSNRSPDPILLGARARAPDGSVFSTEYRARLSRVLHPGDTDDVAIEVGPFPEPGNWSIEVGVLQEGIAWFAGTRALKIDVTIR